MTNPKVADLAGPGIGNYEELEKILPADYSSSLTRRETQKAIFAVKRFIEDNLLQRAEPHHGHGPAHRGRRQRRQ